MSGKDIWTTDEGRQMCRHGGLSHSFNTSCPDEGEGLICNHCGKDVDTHPTVDVSHTDRLALCQDRAIKWQSVEPLVLPTEPTWGIATHHNFLPNAGRWHLEGDEFVDDIGSGTYRAHNVTDFIPLTDEQVARIERTR